MYFLNKSNEHVNRAHHKPVVERKNAHLSDSSKQASNFESVKTSSVSSFEQLGIDKPLLMALKDKGYTKPSQIQQDSIPIANSGRDLIGQSQTGTGKTAAFALSILHRITPELSVTQALILTPTRELAMQVSKEITELSKYTHVSMALLYGGQDFSPQAHRLSRGAQIVVGTPGRVLDHIKQRTLKLDHTFMIVLDEADRMLDMGFIQDVQRIFSYIPNSNNRQVLLFSATMPHEILELSKRYMKNPAIVRVSQQNLSLDSIEQLYVSVDGKVKPKSLASLLAVENPQSSIVFCRTKHGADSLAAILEGYGFSVSALHGNLTQNKREQVLNSFRQGRIKVLVATDVAARGLDITGVSHVFNFDLPNDSSSYVHRIGRTGRAGAKGKAISFVTSLMELKDLKSASTRTGFTAKEIDVDLQKAPEFKRVAPRINSGFQRPRNFRNERSRRFPPRRSYRNSR